MPPPANLEIVKAVLSLILGKSMHPCILLPDALVFILSRVSAIRARAERVAVWRFLKRWIAGSVICLIERTDSLIKDEVS